MDLAKSELFWTQLPIRNDMEAVISALHSVITHRGDLDEIVLGETSPKQLIKRLSGLSDYLETLVEREEMEDFNG